MKKYKLRGIIFNLITSISISILFISCLQDTQKTKPNIENQQTNHFNKKKDNSKNDHHRSEDGNQRSDDGNQRSEESDQTNGLNRNEDHLILTRHARCRMDCRHITEAELKGILHDGKINYYKSELHAKRGPKYAVEGYLAGHQHLRVIFAPEPHAVVVVTCIDLDNEWQCPSCN